MVKKKIATAKRKAVVQLKIRKSSRRLSTPIPQNEKARIKANSIATNSTNKKDREYKKTISHQQHRVSKEGPTKKSINLSSLKSQTVVKTPKNSSENKPRQNGYRHSQLKSKTRSRGKENSLEKGVDDDDEEKIQNKAVRSKSLKTEKKIQNSTRQNLECKTVQGKKIPTTVAPTSNLKKRGRAETKEEYPNIEGNTRQLREKPDMINNRDKRAGNSKKSKETDKKGHMTKKQSTKNEGTHVSNGSNLTLKVDSKNSAKFRTPTKRLNSRILSHIQTTQKNFHARCLSTTKKGLSISQTEPKNKSKVNRPSIKIRKQEKQTRKAKEEKEERKESIENLDENQREEKEEEHKRVIQEENCSLGNNENLEGIILEAVRALKHRSLEDKILDYLRQKYQRLDEIVIRSTIHELLNSGKLSQEKEALKASDEKQKLDSQKMSSKADAPIPSSNILTKDEQIQHQGSAMKLSMNQCNDKLESKMQSIEGCVVNSAKREDIVSGENKQNSEAMITSGVSNEFNQCSMYYTEKSNLNHNAKEANQRSKPAEMNVLKDFIAEGSSVKGIGLKDLLNKTEDSLSQEIKQSRQLSSEEGAGEFEKQEHLVNDRNYSTNKNDTLEFFLFEEKEVYPDEPSNKEFSAQQRKVYNTSESQQIMGSSEKLKSGFKIHESHYLTPEHHLMGELLIEEAQNVKLYSSSARNQKLVREFLNKGVKTSSFPSNNERIFDNHTISNLEKMEHRSLERRSPSGNSFHNNELKCIQQAINSEGFESTAALRLQQIKKMEEECQSPLEKVSSLCGKSNEDSSEKRKIEPSAGKMEIMEEEASRCGMGRLTEQTQEKFNYEGTLKENQIGKLDNEGRLDIVSKNASDAQSIEKAEMETEVRVPAQSQKYLMKPLSNSTETPTYYQTQTMEIESREIINENSIGISKNNKSLEEQSLSKVAEAISGHPAIEVEMKNRKDRAIDSDKFQGTAVSEALVDKMEEEKADSKLLDMRFLSENTTNGMISDLQNESTQILSEEYEPSVSKKIKISPQIEKNKLMNTQFNECDRSQEDVNCSIPIFTSEVCE